MLKLIVVSLFFLEFIYGHTIMSHLVINGNPIETCLKPLPPVQPDWPVSGSSASDPTMHDHGVIGPNFTCGFLPYALQPSPSKCTVNPGDTIGMYFYHGGNDGEYIALSHKGPITAYLAKSNDGSGNVWFKIYELGLLGVYPGASTENGKTAWASPDTLEDQDGVIYFTIPEDISPGNYLLRTELISLHDVSPYGAQPYLRCAELTIGGTGTANPPGVAFPGAYLETDPGLNFNLYQLPYKTAPNWVYPIPGPPVYKAESGTTTSAAATSAAATTTSAAATTSSAAAATTTTAAATTTSAAATTTTAAATSTASATTTSASATTATSSSSTTNQIQDCSSNSECPENAFCSDENLCTCVAGYLVDIQRGCVKALESGAISSSIISYLLAITILIVVL